MIIQKRILVNSFIQILAPITFGTIIYILSRPQQTALSKLFSHGIVHFPNWINYNLPDGLWLFALLNSYLLIWGKKVRQLFVWITGTTILEFSSLKTSITLSVNGIFLYILIWSDKLKC